MNKKVMQLAVITYVLLLNGYTKVNETNFKKIYASHFSREDTLRTGNYDGVQMTVNISVVGHDSEHYDSLELITNTEIDGPMKYYQRDELNAKSNEVDELIENIEHLIFGKE